MKMKKLLTAGMFLGLLILLALFSFQRVTQHAAAAGATANLWVTQSGGSANCVAQSTQVDYATAQANGAVCNSITTADTKAQSGNTVRIVAGTYPAISFSGNTKTVSFIGESTTSVTVSSITLGNDAQSRVANKTFSNMTLTGGFVSKCTDNVTLSNARVWDYSYIESTHDTNFTSVDWDGGHNPPYDDLLDIYTQEPRTLNCSSPKGSDNVNITFDQNLFHGARASNPASHPDGLQIAHGGSTEGGFNTDINIYRTKFYDNECPNIRWNEGDTGVYENNLFYPSVSGASTCDAGGLIDNGGCGPKVSSPGTTQCLFRYNTFIGTEDMQGTNVSKVGPYRQTWIGNVMSRFGGGCNGGGGSGGVYKYNILQSNSVDMNCNGQNGSMGNIRVADRKIDANGVPQAGSPAIDFVPTSLGYPTLDFLGNTRFAGAKVDAGAYETGATSGGGGGGGTATYHSADLTNLLAHYGQTSGQTTATGDLDGNGAVNIYDLGILLADYSP